MGKILITGAAGYVGSTLAKRLIERNKDLWLIDNYYIPSNITKIDGVPIEHRDIRDDIDLSDVEVLFHLAAISGIKRCEGSPTEAFDVNVKGTNNLLKTLKGKIVFASTSAVYGEAAHPTITEMHPAMPLGPYGETKYEAERLVRLSDRYIILRFSNIYGRGLFNKRTVADAFIDNAIAKKPLIIHGDGRQRRDFVHINDAVVAYWRAMNTECNGVYNIGGNEALSVNDIAELVKKQYRSLTGYGVDIDWVETDCGRQWKDFIYACELAKGELYYEPSYSVSDEIRERLNASCRRKDGKISRDKRT